MTKFRYQPVINIQKDESAYELITSEHVSLESLGGREILKVAPEGLALLSKIAFKHVSFYLRASHLKKLTNILEDKDSSENDRFVAYTMLLNQMIAAEGELPTCQDTGTAICIAKKGENVFTGANDVEHLSKGIYDTYQEQNLRYSQMAPINMLEEKNTGTNLPAQIDIYATEGNAYEFLFIAKGGGSANKTYLYQMTKSLLTEQNLLNFVKEKINDLGTSACPPYHLVFVIGGTSAEANLAVVKKLRQGIMMSFPIMAMSLVRLLGIWSGKQKSPKFVMNMALVLNLVASTSFTT